MSVSLHLIIKDEIKPVQNLLFEAMTEVDHIFVTVSDLEAYNVLKEEENEFIKVDYRAWNDRFDEARQHNWDLGKDYDYSMWIDADDSFDFSKIRQIIANTSVDCVFLPYDYDHDDNGAVIVRLWRERIIKRTSPFYWKGWVHENLICSEPFTHERVNIPVVHNQTSEHKDSSLLRNHAILEKAYKETNDPRYIHYLGISYFSMKDWENAITVLEKYLELGEWTEEIYRTLIKISESHFLLGNIELAILSALKAVGVNNKLPQAYHLLAHYEYQDKDYEAAILYANDALSRPDPEDSSIWDPTARDRTYLTMAMCHYESKDYRNAYTMLQKVRSIDTSDVIDEFKDKANLEVFKEIIPGMVSYYENPTSLWTGLKDEYKFSSELRDFRLSVTQPHIWAEKTIVFFCGKGYEEWGPHTLDKGMGGSEEAIVYLSRELAKLGYGVFVYGEVENEYFDEGVMWLPWNRFDVRDTFDTLVIWRQPQLASQLTARQMFIDMHDALPAKIVQPHKNATYLFKSQYHKDLYPDVKKFYIIPNGVVTKQFKPTKKKTKSVIYPSAYYRGAETLLKCWPEIKRQVPEATLDLYYGWESWLSGEGEDAFYQRMVKKFENMKDLGVTEHGRVSHEVLAEKFAQAKVWAYPTEFNEIFCITAVKANLAGCKPVLTDVAALKETCGPNAAIVESDTIYTDEYAQKIFIDHVVKYLNEENDPTEQIKWAKKFDYSNIAKQWGEIING